MSKFWAIATVLLLTGVSLLVLGPMQEGVPISFTDLETECQYDRGSELDIGLEGDSVTFSGQFPVGTVNTDLDYSYTVSGSDIRLNIIADSQEVPADFFNTCKGIVIYDAETHALEPGNYTVTVLHDGVREKRIGIGIRTKTIAKAKTDL